jgi:Matrixin
LIQSWRWYTRADPTAIQARQFDFETAVMHELGHVLGLGHSADATSIMFATLGAGAANRNLTVADLNVPDTDGGGGSGLHARVFRPAPPPTASTAQAPPTLNQNLGLMAWDLAVADLSGSGLGRTQRKRP